MSLKLFISDKYLSVGWIILYLAGIYLTGHLTAQPTSDTCTGLLAPGAGQWLAPTPLNRLLNALFVLMGGVLLLRINNRFSLIQRHTLLPFLFFLLFELVSPSLTLLGDGNVAGTETIPRERIYGIVDCGRLHLLLARVWLWMRPVRKYPLWLLRRICRK